MPPQGQKTGVSREISAAFQHWRAVGWLITCFLPQNQCSGRAGACAFFYGVFQGVCNRAVERDGDANVEPSADEAQAEFFALLCGDLDAQTAVDALARFVDHFAVLCLLFEESTRAFVSTRVGMIFVGIFSEFAGIGFATVTIQTARRFGGGLGGAESCLGVGGGLSWRVACTGFESFDFIFFESADARVEGFFRTGRVL